MQELHWLHDCFLDPFQSASHYYEALHCLGHLTDHLPRQISAHFCLRPSNEGQLQIQPIKEVRLVRTWERAFSVAAPQFWNSTSREARFPKNLLYFQRILSYISRLLFFSLTFSNLKIFLRF